MRTAILLSILVSFSASAGRRVRVRSHTTKRGSYVHSHSRSAPDGRKSNNWSTKGNHNPTTGKAGTK